MLRHRITMQRPDPTSPLDNTGQRLTTWIDVLTDEPAAVEPVSGREAFLAAQRQAATTHIVTLRRSAALAAIDGSWRVLFGTRELVLDGPPIDVGERGRELRLTCIEGLRTE
jgi:SPP1 family predicted phage head-tail adaptor